MYTVTFQDANGAEQISSYFPTIKAARNWAKWLTKQRFVRTVSLYQGQAGEMLLERVASMEGVLA